MAAAKRILTACNTLSLTAGVPLRLTAPAAGRYTVNVFNLGPGTVWYRFDGDASLNDALSVTVPANTHDNEIRIDGAQGVCVISDMDTKLSIRGRMY